MKEARLIMPLSLILHIETAEAILSQAFGGVTRYHGEGKWKSDDGDMVAENVVILDVAYEPNRENDLKLYDIADQFRNITGENAVYLRYGNGNVQLVTARSCMDNGEKEAFDWDRLRRELEPNAPDDIGEIIPDTTHPVAA